MRILPRGVAALVLLLALLGSPFPAAAQLSVVGVSGMRLVYLDPSETFLVPHAACTFLNSLAFQRRLFDFHPKQPVFLLLTDISDTGNAGASVVPRDVVTVEIAPLNFAFETIAGNERMNILMNHELVHIATMDQAAGADRVFRRLFGGKVVPVPDQPESILYFLLTTPRVASPRWYHEGIAVFVDTWMSGGLGRAQSGYDEMVFRSMVRDGTPFYDPLGLVSERHPDRFPGAGELLPVWHPFHDLAGTPLLTRAGHRLGLAPRRQPRLLRDSVQARLRHLHRTGLGRLGEGRRGVPASEPGRDPRLPGDALEGPHHTGAGIGLARVLRS